MIDVLLIVSVFIGSCILAFVLSIPIISILYKFSIVRKIDVDFSTLIEARKLKVGTPIMGGLIVVLAVLLVNLIFNLNGTTKVPLLVFTISALLGAFDDILNIYGRKRPVKKISRILMLIKVHASPLMRLYYLLTLPWAIYKRLFFMLGSNPGKGIQAHEKILVQAIAGGIVAVWIYFLAGFPMPGFLWIPFLGGINIGWLMIPFIIFVVISMANAVNIADGMDGLSAGLLLSSFGAFLAISLLQLNIPIALLCASVTGALTAYLYFNIPPARFQMGDVGSLALGTLLAAIAFALEKPLLLIPICMMFIAEIATTLIQGIARRTIGRRIFRMAPLHHHYELKGWPETKVVMRFWLFSNVFAAIGIWLSFY